MATTLKDIAQRAGVTSATVSMVINNKPNISKATREKVLAIARELNYHPNVIARGLATRKTNAIGIVVPNLASSFVVRVMQGIKSSISEKDYTVLLFDTIGHMESEMDVFNRVVLEGRVDGAIIITAKAIDDELKLFANENKPCIMVARRSEVVDSVYVNHTRAAQEAVDYLLEKGHKSVAIVVDDKKPLVMEDRVNGYRQALEAKGIPAIPPVTVEDDTAGEGGRIVDCLLSLDPKPTALFCAAGDMVAIGVIKELKKRGIRVPENMAVLGYDDIPAAEVVEPALTTVRQPKLEMGDYAINMVIDKIEGREKGMKHKELNAKLIVRESA